MRARVTAIVLSMLTGLGILIMGASAAWASTPTPETAPLGSAASQWQTVVDGASTASVIAAGDESGPSVHGTLRAKTGPADENGNRARQPIPDVTVTVSTLDGDKVGSAVSNDKGQWRVSVPQAGHYQVELDVSTLPDSVDLKKGASNPLPDVRVQSAMAGIAVFSLVPEGGATAEGTSQLTFYLSLAVKGLRFGLIVAMTAVGLSLVFGTTGLINFAHGELVTLGMVVTYVAGTSWLHIPLIVSVIIAIVLLCLFGGFLDLVLWRPLRKRGTGLIQMFIISIGLSLFLRHLILFFLGGSRHQYLHSQKSLGAANWDLGPVEVSPTDGTIIIISIIVLIAVALMLQKTRMGKSMRALSDNRDLAEASGINVERVITQVWVLGGGLAALGGVFFGLTTAVYWNAGYYLLLLMFAGVILGGLGSAYGAMLGSIIIGFIVQFSVAFSPSSMQNAWALLLLVVVLLIRPQGILGRLQRAG